MTGQPIALLGLRGVGKSTVGELLARVLARPFLDLDLLVVDLARREGESCDEPGKLLLRLGEPRFRDLESRVLTRALSWKPAAVLATGGGIVERPENRAALAAGALSIHLDAPTSLLAARLTNDPTQRPPLLGGTSAIDELPDLLERRSPHYRSLASFVVDATGTPEEVVRRIARSLVAKGLARLDQRAAPL